MQLQRKHSECNELKMSHFPDSQTTHKQKVDVGPTLGPASGAFVLDDAKKATLNAALVSLGPSFNQFPIKQIFEAVENTWADSFFSAFLSTVMIFGGIAVAVFLAVGANTSQGLHWAVKEYSDNVADVCSVITIAYLAYTYRMVACSAIMAFKTGLPRSPEELGMKFRQNLGEQVQGTLPFSVYAVLAMLAVLAPVAAVTCFLFDGSRKSFQVLLQNQFDEVLLCMLLRNMLFCQTSDVFSGSRSLLNSFLRFRRCRQFRHMYLLQSNLEGSREGA
jgi:magnesium-transporting ATPase (P-type)